jgi:DNA-binding NtrC family response regulator
MRLTIIVASDISGFVAISLVFFQATCKTYPGFGRWTALVVLDLIMPQMGGTKCLEELLRINPDVKVILSTGHFWDAPERLSLGSLARGFVNKPYEVRQMVQAVRGVLDVGRHE